MVRTSRIFMSLISSEINGAQLMRLDEGLVLVTERHVLFVGTKLFCLVAMMVLAIWLIRTCLISKREFGLLSSRRELRLLLVIHM